MNKIVVVIPAYMVKDKILEVIKHIDSNVSSIFVIDDKCPQNTGLYVKGNCHDDRVKVIFNAINLGVGGSTKIGFL